MADGELAARERNEITEIGAMSDVWQEGAVFIVNRLPVGAVHLGVIEVVALRAPRFLEDLRPLRARIDEHLELPEVDDAVADLRRLVRRDNSPPCLRRAARRLIEQLLVIARERVRSDALEDWRRHPLLERVFLQLRHPAGVRLRVEIEERTRGTSAQVTEVAGRNAYRQNALGNAFEVDADLRRRRVGARLRRERKHDRLGDRLVTRFREQR